MADRVDWYFRQKVTEAELDSSMDDFENAIWFVGTDLDFLGIVVGLDVVEFSTPNLTVDVVAGTAFEQFGKRVRVPSLQNLDVSVDSDSISTAVGTPANTKIVSVFVKFARALSDQRTDGNSNTVFFERNESFEFVVRQGAESAGTPAPPAPESDAVLLADITLSFGQTQIFNASIDLLDRRQDAFAVTTSTLEIREGTLKEAIEATLQELDDHITGVGVKHLATVIDYAGGPNWADSSTNPAATVEAQLDKMIDDLGNVSGSGASKIAVPAKVSSPFSYGSGILKNTLESLLASINTFANNVADTTAASDGAAEVGAEIKTIGSRILPVGTVRSQLDVLHSWFDDLDGIAAPPDDGASEVGAGANGISLLAGTVRSQLDALDTLAHLATRVLYVDAGVVSNGTGSPSNPNKTLADAMSVISASSETDFVVFVAPGSYAGFTTPSAKNVSIIGAGRRVVQVTTPVVWTVAGGEKLFLKGIEFGTAAEIRPTGAIVAVATFLNAEQCTFLDTDPAINLGAFSGNPGALTISLVGDVTPLGLSSGEPCLARGISGGTDDVDVLVRLSTMRIDGNVTCFSCVAHGCAWVACTLAADTASGNWLYQCATSVLDVFFSSGPGSTRVDEFTNFFLKATGTHTNMTKTIQEDPVI